MRVIEEQMIAAIHACNASGAMKNLGNTQVYRDSQTGNTCVRLHANLIAIIKSHEIDVTLAYWGTPTTRSRVNAILGEFAEGRHYFSQSKGEQMFNGVPTTCHAWHTVARAHVRTQGGAQ
jgi:hypothetical protein